MTTVLYKKYTNLLIIEEVLLGCHTSNTNDGNLQPDTKLLQLLHITTITTNMQRLYCDFTTDF
jgi:hypothetical protein